MKQNKFFLYGLFIAITGFGMQFPLKADLAAIKIGPLLAKDSSQTSSKILRSYEAGLTREDREIIAYVINTLGNESLLKLAGMKSSLKKAGDKIDHVHPLRFLECIFTDEEMKVSVYKMQNRGWVWKEFFKGVKGSLSEESEKKNVTTEQINDFAKILQLDPKIITPAIAAKDWTAFVDLLIKNLPRKGNPNRYDT